MKKLSVLVNILMCMASIEIVSKCVNSESVGSHNSTIDPEHHDGPHILSRRKRFLIYPEGSSLQLVFCLSWISTIEIGDIFLWGSTAALAWELPQDPYSPLDNKADPLHRRVDKVKNIYYLDEQGKVINKVPYKRKTIINPAMAKRSIPESGNAIPDIGFVRKRMHEDHVTRDYLNATHMDSKAVQFHRDSRKGLFVKLEVFLKALGLNGRQCVLKTLCEVGNRNQKKQGTFIDELITAVFTLPKGEDFTEEYHREYDLAHNGGDCEAQFPQCEGSVTNLPI